MTVLTVTPKDKQHWLDMKAKDISSTEASSLFGANPYCTLFELWHRKKSGEIQELEPNERMTWGTRLEAAIAAGIAEDNNLIINSLKDYMTIPELRMGSSFDFSVGDDGLLEIKNVDSLMFRDGWIENEDGTVEGPAHIEIQVQHQMFISGRKFALIGALVGGNKVQLIRRERDEEVIDAIKVETAKFWKSIDENIEPAPDFAKDHDMIRKLHNYAEPGTIVDITINEKLTQLAHEYKRLGEEMKLLDSSRDAIKSEMLIGLGEAEKAIGNGFTVSLGTTTVGEKVVKGYSFRQFRINWPRGRKE